MEANETIKDKFPDGLIPNNSNIDKTRTGNGLTTAELLAERHSIIVNPQVNTIAAKKDFCINHGINVHAIYSGEGKCLAEFLKTNQPKKKIFVTPESFPLIITAAKKADVLQYLYDNFFCLLDESHCFASEKFREGILRPFKYFFNFKNKSMGSATPFPYTDPRILGLRNYKMIYGDPIGKIQIIHGNKPQEVLCEMIKNWDFKGNVHIFFNTVTSCGNIIRASGITNFNIYCVPSERNEINLHELKNRIVDKPVECHYAKFNFYSCRYVEGWDMYDDENATMIFVTDISVKHSLMNIGIKGVQCVGRLRQVKPLNIYHVTNNFNKSERLNKSISSIQFEIETEAQQHIAYFNKYTAVALKENRPIPDRLLDLIKPFAKLNDKTTAIYNHMLSNQMLYEEYTRFTFNNAKSIRESWQNAQFDVNEIKWDLDTIEVKDKSKNEINKEVYALILKYRSNPEKYSYGNSRKAFISLRGKYQILFQAVDILCHKMLHIIDFNDQLMKEELIKHSNANSIGSLKFRLTLMFKINLRYTRKYIKSKLQLLYDEFNISDKSGKRRIAKATDLKEYGLFDLKECKVNDDSGKRQLGYLIESKHFFLKQAS